ncbi:MAG TPA: hypothetical protein G4O04_02380 [Anaerolineae bacterium]|nr:hypothetical protein [Anaerolineae bacterium]HID85720.1 hypothetical protein [Anaerolineales bacterium]HIQ09489.1 hypothetical protein [Anaerolineaceae bacterium]
MPEPSPKDWEALSAYLDGQLLPRERARLEARLADDPALRQALAELRALRAALRHLPPPRVPRNFTLRPEMVAPTPWWAGWWRWATALTALLLALVVLADWGLGRTLKMAAAPPEMAPAPTPSVEALAPAPREEQALGMAAAEGQATASEAPQGAKTRPNTPTPMPTPTPEPVGGRSPARAAPVSPWRVMEGVLLGVLLALLVGRRWLGRR